MIELPVVEVFELIFNLFFSRCTLLSAAGVIGVKVYGSGLHSSPGFVAPLCQRVEKLTALMGFLACRPTCTE